MNKVVPQILITGSDGFIGKNLKLRLEAENKFKINTYTKKDKLNSLQNSIEKSEIIIHLAGVNRPTNVLEFKKVNVNLTRYICEIILNAYKLKNHKCKLILVSSSQASLKNNYGKSKLQAENLVLALEKEIKNSVLIFRLPGVFGKFCKPNYNSVVSTFCHNVVQGLPLLINEPNKQLNLIYIDSVVDQLIEATKEKKFLNPYCDISNIFKITIEELANKIKFFHTNRTKLKVGHVGLGIDRALYATYLTHLPKKNFSYKINENNDERGKFVEILKTQNSGQISFLTAKPGVTRGGHYHNTKSEKFLVIKGKARFRFKNVIDNNFYEIITSSQQMEVVDTIPGWAHDITNVGNEDLLVILWANEVFNHSIPDTIPAEITK